MAAYELPDKRTPLNLPDLCNQFIVDWPACGVEATRPAVELKVAHVHAETGLTHCHNWNIGNIKATVIGPKGWTGHWQYFGCGENVSMKRARELQAAPMGELVSITSKPFTQGGVECVTIWIKPKHPWSRFRAFLSLGDGVATQLSYLKARPSVLAALMTGDPLKYSEALRAVNYFTADPQVYAKLLVKRLAIVKAATADWIGWGDLT